MASKPTLHGPRVTLRQLDERDVEEQLRSVPDPEMRRLWEGERYDVIMTAALNPSGNP